MNKRNFAAACAVGVAFAALPALAQTTYPERAIKIYQGFAPGGNADAIARAIGVEMGKALGQPIVVEAQSGAGGFDSLPAVWLADFGCAWRFEFDSGGSFGRAGIGRRG